MKLCSLLSNKTIQKKYNINIIYEKMPSTIESFFMMYNGRKLFFINNELSYLKRKKNISKILNQIKSNKIGHELFILFKEGEKN